MLEPSRVRAFNDGPGRVAQQLPAFTWSTSYEDTNPGLAAPHLRRAPGATRASIDLETARDYPTAPRSCRMPIIRGGEGLGG